MTTLPLCSIFLTIMCKAHLSEPIHELPMKNSMNAILFFQDKFPQSMKSLFYEIKYEMTILPFYAFCQH